ncbi:MAG: sodium:solute symporter [Bacteroidia bacterium]|nr:sodium:solute symporter [Bacteroidia bacterium]
MSQLDWAVLFLTLAGIVLYGMYKSRGQTDLESYFLNNRSMPWYIVLFSIMGTQASAITFLSAPGQAYTDGMRFVQYYFGLPLAMIVICAFFLPVYQKLNLYTAYEFLEKRFDRKTRLLTSFLFLLQRGLSTGISIYAPSLILSSLLGWNIHLTNLLMGGLLILYTVSGGVKAIAYTQTQQLLIIFCGMFLSGYMVVKLLPEHIGFFDSLHLAGASGKLNVITTGISDGDFNWKDKYNLFSGIIGGFFLALSYFGTDQSQVGRYLAAGNLQESRRGLLMNGIVKIPMQFLILLVGSLVFSFYVIYEGPVHFNTQQFEKAKRQEAGQELRQIESGFNEIRKEQRTIALAYLEAKSDQQEAKAIELKNELRDLDSQSQALRKKAATVIKKTMPLSDSNDTNYIFLHFVVHHLPKGLVGLLVAIIFLAAWGSIAAALNSLASTCIIDWHQPLRPKERTDKRNLQLSRLYTFGWGVFSILVASLAGKLGSLIEAVNILGSLFYGTILGIFVSALFIKKLKGAHVFYAALLTEVIVIAVYFSDAISFLWLNLIGCALVIVFAGISELIFPYKASTDHNQ